MYHLLLMANCQCHQGWQNSSMEVDIMEAFPIFSSIVLYMSKDCGTLIPQKDFKLISVTEVSGRATKRTDVFLTRPSVPYYLNHVVMLQYWSHIPTTLHERRLNE